MTEGLDGYCSVATNILTILEGALVHFSCNICYLRSYIIVSDDIYGAVLEAAFCYHEQLPVSAGVCPTGLPVNGGLGRWTLRNPEVSYLHTTVQGLQQKERASKIFSKAFDFTLSNVGQQYKHCNTMHRNA